MSKNCPDLPCQRFSIMPGNTKNCQICQRFNIMLEIEMSKNCQIFLAEDLALENWDVEKLPDLPCRRFSIGKLRCRKIARFFLPEIWNIRCRKIARRFKKQNLERVVIQIG
ncbi:unnamed protein product [Rhizophagus irregularis]|nr:unnamed protein product [Rhizophagus irregularis]